MSTGPVRVSKKRPPPVKPAGAIVCCNLQEKSERVSPSALLFRSDQPLRRWVFPAPASAVASSFPGSVCSSDPSAVSADFFGERNSNSET